MEVPSVARLNARALKALSTAPESALDPLPVRGRRAKVTDEEADAGLGYFDCGTPTTAYGYDQKMERAVADKESTPALRINGEGSFGSD